MNSWMALAAAAKAEDTGPTWLAIVGAIGLGSVLSALITAGSLIYQNKKNAERDDQRRTEDATERQREREAASAVRAEDRAHALQDHWRPVRADLVQEFVTHCNVILTTWAAGQAFSVALKGTESADKVDAALTSINKEFDQTLNPMNGMVQFASFMARFATLCTPPVVEAAGELRDICIEMLQEFQARSFSEDSGPKFHKHMANFQRAVSKELGTEK